MGEKEISRPKDSANLMAFSSGNAIASIPAFTANVSVIVLCFPFGLMHPKAIGILGIMSLAVTNTFAMSAGSGGFSFSIGVP